MKPAATPMPALFSIHDVMPETLAQVDDLLQLFRAYELAPPALLVVPGRDWNAASIAQLAAWEEAGSELVAHGWVHHTRPRRLFHRVHALLLSRNVAEHLDYDRDGVIALMNRSRQWFIDQHLPIPSTYIPPAWALGLPARELPGLPFNCIETLGGVYLCDQQKLTYQSLPLIGFEADTLSRQTVLRGWNLLQLWQAKMTGRTLRVSIHPRDAQLRLAEVLKRTMALPWDTRRYDQLLASA